jgi:hypothetical protein
MISRLLSVIVVLGLLLGSYGHPRSVMAQDPRGR